MIETTSYIEIKVPIAYNHQTLERLRGFLGDLPIRWQQGFYHITLCFVNSTKNVDEVSSIMCKYLENADSITITLDKFDAFTTYSGMHVIYLTSSNSPADFLWQIEKMRNEIRDSDSLILSDFRLHVTLGRIASDNIAINDLRQMINKVKFGPFTLVLNEVVYRYFRGGVIKKIILKS